MRHLRSFATVSEPAPDCCMMRYSVFMSDAVPVMRCALYHGGRNHKHDAYASMRDGMALILMGSNNWGELWGVEVKLRLSLYDEDVGTPTHYWRSVYRSFYECS